MSKRLLIDATHSEEVRVAVVDGSTLEEFDSETSHKQQIKSNIYLAKVIRVEPSLQAAFVEYNGGRHGFLPFNEIHPDYFKIPIADRQALEQALLAAEDEFDEELEEEANNSAPSSTLLPSTHRKNDESTLTSGSLDTEREADEDSFSRRRKRRGGLRKNTKLKKAPQDQEESHTESSDQPAIKNEEFSVSSSITTPDNASIASNVIEQNELTINSDPDSKVAQSKTHPRRSKLRRRSHSQPPHNDNSEALPSALESAPLISATPSGDAVNTERNSPDVYSSSSATSLEETSSVSKEISGSRAHKNRSSRGTAFDKRTSKKSLTKSEEETADPIIVMDMPHRHDLLSSAGTLENTEDELLLDNATSVATREIKEVESLGFSEDEESEDLLSDEEQTLIEDLRNELKKTISYEHAKEILLNGSLEDLDDDVVQAISLSKSGAEIWEGEVLDERFHSLESSSPYVFEDASAYLNQKQSEDDATFSESKRDTFEFEDVNQSGEDDDDEFSREVELDSDVSVFSEKKSQKKNKEKNSVLKELNQRYKIQEVIKRRQILLVQVVKEERGNKGASLTTFLSLPGRYCVLMPNAGHRSGGISRKISDSEDRRRLKELMQEFEVPQGMSLIVRTAGQEKSKAEIRRDYEYLLRLWDDIREKTLTSIAPSIVYTEGDLIKRAIRDIYDKDISEVLIEGEEAYKSAKAFMKSLIPSHAKKVRLYKDNLQPIFHRFNVEAQIEKMHDPVQPLPSGGSIVINHTEALVAIDVNSGRSTKERHIDETAFKTNMEAAVEIARQLRLRDIGGLVVVDFIDMHDSSHIHQVERKFKEALKNDRARIQIGRISQFGLLELSRQRLRPSMLENHFTHCHHCQGRGLLRSNDSLALQALREIERLAVSGTIQEMRVTVPSGVDLYLLNHKRSHIVNLETRFEMKILIERDDTISTFNILITEEKTRVLKRDNNSLTIASKTSLSSQEEDDSDNVPGADEQNQSSASSDREEQRDPRNSRKRRQGRRDRDRRKPVNGQTTHTMQSSPEEASNSSFGSLEERAPSAETLTSYLPSNELKDEETHLNSQKDGSSQYNTHNAGPKDRRKRRNPFQRRQGHRKIGGREEGDGEGLGYNEVFSDSLSSEHSKQKNSTEKNDISERGAFEGSAQTVVQTEGEVKERKKSRRNGHQNRRHKFDKEGKPMGGGAFGIETNRSKDPRDSSKSQEDGGTGRETSSSGQPHNKTSKSSSQKEGEGLEKSPKKTKSKGWLRRLLDA